MKCHYCKRPISTSDAKRAVIWYRTPDGSEFMFCAPEGTGRPPAGSRVIRAGHYKHWQASRTGEQSGQRVTYAPGVYEIGGLVESGAKLALTVDQRRVSYLESQGWTHQEAEAFVANRRQALENDADPEYVDREPQDWRDQDQAEV